MNQNRLYFFVMAKLSGIILLFLLLMSGPFLTAVFSADEILLPEEETPGTFLDIGSEDEDVRLFLIGSWKADISASAGFGWSAGSGFDGSLFYPGISDGFTFSQSPDITASLLILNRYIFEAAFTDDFADSTFMLGYRGLEGEFVRSISAGNMEISMSDDVFMTDYFYIPGGGPSSFGIHSALEGPVSTHELLLRFDPQEELHKTWIGGDSVLEIEINVYDYLKGRFFYIPDAPPDALFYRETASGPVSAGSRKYEQMQPEDFSYSSADGLVYFDSRPEGAVLVRSASTDWITVLPGSPVVDTSLGTMLLLYEPGIFSEFESAAAYAVNTVMPEDKWKTRFYLSPGIELTGAVMNDEGIVILDPAAGGSAKYPLSGIISDADKIYGTESVPAEGVIGPKLIFQIRETESSYSIDNPVPGTVRIYINGIESFNWSESSGIITFNNEPAADDRIEAVYRRKSGGSTGGDILFASANSFNTGKGWTADLNAGLRLNISGSYSLPGEETSAYGGLSAGVRYDSSVINSGSAFTLEAGITAGTKLSTENSAGRLLLKNMSGDFFDVAVNRKTVYPASLSEILADSLSPGLGLDIGGRGRLLYKDYRLSTGITTYLQDYTAAIDSSMIFSPENSTVSDRFKSGPYTAAARSDNRTGEILVMDFILPDNKSWAGIQIPVSEGSVNPDLSAVNALSFDCKTEGVLTDVELYLEIGSISEDLDGDGFLDAETSEYSSGFIFNDPNTAAGTLIGGDNLTGGNGKLDSEDFNGNGFIDREKKEAVAVFPGIAKPGSDWQKLTFYFTDMTETVSQNSRKRLKNAEFIRITAVNTSSGEKSGRILFDNFHFEGAAMFADDSSGWTAPEFSETDEAMIPAGEKPAEALSSPTVGAGTENRVMRVDWNDDWKLYSYISPVPAFEYGSTVFYIYCPELTPAGAGTAAISLNLLDDAGKGIRASVPLTAGTAWRRIEINSLSGSVLTDGEPAENAALEIDADAGDLHLLELSTSGTDSGTVYIDEISLENPRLHAVSGLSAQIEANSAEPVLHIDDLSIIGPVNFKAKASADLSTETTRTDELMPEVLETNGSMSFYSAVETRIFSAPFSADISWLSGSPGNLAAGHDLGIPLFDGSLIISDSFSTAETSGGNFSKTNSVKLDTGLFGGKIAEFQALYDSGLLIRKWFSELNTKIEPFSLGLSLDLLLSDFNHPFTWNNYLSGWYDGTVLAADFAAAELQQRKAVLSVSPALTAAPLGIRSGLSLTSDIDKNGSMRNAADIFLGLPLNINTGFDQLDTEISYARSGSFTYMSDSSGFAGDIAGLAATTADRTYLYSSVPFYELFEDGLPRRIFDDCTAAGIDSAFFINTLGFTMSRNYSSRLIDLLLPYSAEFSLKRNIHKDYSDLEEDLGLDIIWRSAAINLFGSAGVYPFFDFYFSDELNWSVEASVTEPFSENSVQEYIIKSGWSLFGHSENILSLDGSVYLPFNLDDSSAYVKTLLMYVWNRYPESAVDIPLFSADEERNQVITHEEKLSLNFENTFSTELRHSTSIIIPQRFTLTAFALAGFEYNNMSENDTALFGFSFGISGSVIY